MLVHAPPMTNTTAATIDSLQSVTADQGDHHFFLNHLATVKVGAGGSDSGLALVEFVAPRGFGPPLHVHTEEDELMYVLDGEIRIDLGDGDSTVASAGAAVTLPHGIPHTWQVLSDEARFLTVNAGRRHGPSFDQFVVRARHADRSERVAGSDRDRSRARRPGVRRARHRGPRPAAATARLTRSRGLLNGAKVEDQFGRREANGATKATVGLGPVPP